MKIEDVVREVLVAILDVDRGVSGDDITMDSISKWDSMRQLSIVAALENEFGLFIEAEEAVNLTSYNKIVFFLLQHPDVS